MKKNEKLKLILNQLKSPSTFSVRMFKRNDLGNKDENNSFFSLSGYKGSLRATSDIEAILLAKYKNSSPFWLHNSFIIPNKDAEAILEIFNDFGFSKENNHDGLVITFKANLEHDDYYSFLEKLVEV